MNDKKYKHCRLTILTFAVHHFKMTQLRLYDIHIQQKPNSLSPENYKYTGHQQWANDA